MLDLHKTRFEENLYDRLQENHSKPSCVAKVRSGISATHSVSEESECAWEEKRFEFHRKW